MLGGFYNVLKVFITRFEKTSTQNLIETPTKYKRKPKILT
jgi:hypothetical protein